MPSSGDLQHEPGAVIHVRAVIPAELTAGEADAGVRLGPQWGAPCGDVKVYARW
jgi:hypothetical protein